MGGATIIQAAPVAAAGCWQQPPAESSRSDSGNTWPRLTHLPFAQLDEAPVVLSLDTLSKILAVKLTCLTTV